MSGVWRMPDEGTVNDNTETTADPMSFDEQSGSIGSSVYDGPSAEPDTIEGPVASSAFFLGNEESPTAGAAAGHPHSGRIRRQSSGMEEVVTHITEGQLRTIDLELVAHRRAALGSFSIRESGRQSPQKADPPTDGTSRRDAVVRADCDYGMDAVGNHVAAVMEWIAEAHEMDDEPGVETQHSAGFMPRRPLTLRSRAYPEGETCVQDNVFPEGVKVNGSFEMALAGLNSCLYEADRQRQEEEKSEEATEVAVEHVGDVDRIVEAVARIPSLMKTVILIEDNEDRNFVLSNPVIRCAMLSPYSILNADAAFEKSRLKQDTQSGDVNELTLPSHDRGRSWLLEMLKLRDNNLTDKAIDYMEVLSSLSVNDYVSIRQPPMFVRQRGVPLLTSSRRAPLPSMDDEIEFNHLKETLFKTVGSLKLLIAHFFKLYTPDIERASTLPVIRRALDDAISQPFFMCIIFFDLVFHIILLLSFRFFNFQVVAVRSDVDDLRHGGYGVDFLGLIGLIAAFYFSFRVVGNIMSMSRVSWHVFCANFFNLWQLVEVAAISMVMVSLCIIRRFDVEALIKYRANDLFIFNAFTTGLLWLNFVGFLRVLNWKLATFVLAILQIICDISLFIFLMLILVLAFGDMFYTMIAADPAVCSNTENLLQTLLEKLGFYTDDAIEPVPVVNRTDGFSGLADEDSPICESRGQSYFAIYRVLVGDVSADEFAVSPVTTIIFIVMTFLGVIIMLNILIAIVDESYERSTMRAERLFGRARITLVAKIAALEELLHPMGSWQSTLSRGFLLHNIMRLVAFTVAGTIAYVLVDIAEITHLAFVNLQIARSGAIALTVVVIIPFGLFILISTTFLITGWEEGRTRLRFLQRIQHTRIIKYCFMYPVRFIVQNLLGTSQAFHRKSHSHEDEWHGRLNHIKREVKTCMSESESRINDVIARLEMKLEKEAEQRRNDAVEFEKHLARVEDRAIAARKRELEDLERRVVQAITNALSEQLNKDKEAGQEITFREKGAGDRAKR